MALVTYFVDKMRAVPPTGKVAENNPERVLTVNGVFYSTKIDENGNRVRNEKMSYTTKAVDIEDVLAGAEVDLDAGTLTIPAGERGRKADPGLDANSVTSLLNSIRNPIPEPEPTPAPATKSK